MISNIFLLLAVSVSACLSCTGSFDVGTGSKTSQKFYWDPSWTTCFAFQYKGTGGNDNKFDSFDECIGKCRPLGGSACTGPQGSAVIDGPLLDCDSIKCPKDHSCHYGTFPECCNDSFIKERDDAFERTCPGGKKSEGFDSGDSWNPLLGSTCDNLKCQKGNKCVQISKHFAKCCGNK